MGFISDKGAYIHDGWNKLDFLIVMVSFFDMQSIFQQLIYFEEAGSSLAFFKVLRMLRTLRPLRFISHNVHLKLIVNSLLDSIGPIVNVFLIVLLILFMFSIAGINLFYTNYDTCYAVGNYNLAIPGFSDLEAIYGIYNDSVAREKLVRT